MFCSNCGAKAAGNFCSACGQRLTAAAPLVPVVPVAPIVEAPPPAQDNIPVLELAEPDWHYEIRYNVLLHFPEVRDLIAKHAANAHQELLSGEPFLEICDALLKPFSPISLKTMTSIMVPIYTRIGIWTEKKRTETIAAPAGKVLIAAICSLARHSWKLKDVHQADDGCVIEGALPPDIKSLEGKLLVTVHREKAGTMVEVAAKIPGQLYDWGKCNKCLDQLVADLRSLLDEKSEPIRKAA